MPGLRLLSLACLILALLGLHSPAWANVDAVTTSPASTNVPLGRSVSIAMTWVIDDVYVAGVPASATVNSSLGQFRDSLLGSLVLGSVNRTISKTYNPNAGSNTVLIQETVSIPAEVIVRAHQAGLSSFVYRRQFTPAGAGDIGAITLRITSSAAGGFYVSRLGLSFNDGTAAKSTAPDSELRAQATIGYSGSGLLRAVWEVAAPPSTLGQAVYRPLQGISRYTVPGEALVLSSPDLPTTQTGLYLLRLRITQPTVAFEAPVIRYQVRQEIALKKLRLRHPAQDATLQKTTRFQWQAVSGSARYRLEFHASTTTSSTDLPDLGSGSERDHESLLPTTATTGILVPGEQNSATLAAASRRHLRPGEQYRWRVIAMDKDGVTFAISPWRRLSIP